MAAIATRETVGRRTRTRSNGPALVGLACLLPAVLILPLWAGVDPYRLCIVAVYVLAAIGMNVATGYSGQFFVGQPLVMAVAGYVGAYLATVHQWNGFLTLPVALAAGTFAGVLVALPGLRLSGYYLAAVSVFAVLAIPDVARIFDQWTGGENGINGIPALSIQGRDLSLSALYVMLAVIVSVVLFLLWQFLIAGWRVRLGALREAPLALRAVGTRVVGVRLMVYFVSALPAGIAGWALVFLTRSVEPTMFGFSLMLLLMASVELGGSGTLAGPVVGAVVLGLYREVLAANSEWNTLGLGIILVVVAGGFSGGIVGLSRKRVLPAMRLRFAAVGTVPPELTDQQYGADPRPEVVVGRRPLSAPGTLLVLADNLSKSFGGVQAIEQVSLSLYSTEIVAIIGQNGSGKTTLVNLITGAISPDSGTVVHYSESLDDRRIPEISRTYQVPALVPELTPIANAELGLLRTLRPRILWSLLRPRRAGTWRSNRAAVAAFHCGELGIEPSELQLAIEDLPLGHHRLTEVARSMSTGAPVICLDEPAAGLTDEEMVRLGLVLRAAADGGRSVLIVEHHLGFVQTLADRIVLCDRGRVVADVNPDSTSEQWLLVNEYFSRSNDHGETRPELTVRERATGGV